MVQHPGEYPWSSYRRNALRLENRLISEHAEYYNLGGNKKERAESYKLLFERVPPENELDELRIHTQSGTPLGSSKFREQVELTLAMKIGQPSRGRPGRKDGSIIQRALTP